MPKFTIRREGRLVEEVTLEGERIEMGSAHTCQLIIDDLLIALKQAVFVREESGDSYRVEPLSRVPSFKLDGQTVEGPTPIPHSAMLEIEGYEIAIACEPTPSRVSPGVPAQPAVAPSRQDSDELPIPEPLPEPPPPLDLTPVPPMAPSPPPKQPPVSPGPGADSERTVFVRTVGRLAATAGPLAGQSWDLRDGETRIGRDTSQNQIVVRFDPNGQVDTSISRRHASIHVVGGRLYVEDQNSAAGTFVNGEQVPPGQKVEIRSGDMIEIRSARVSTILKLELGQPSAAPVPPAPPPLPPVRPQPVSRPPEPPLPQPLPEPSGFSRDEGAGFDPILSGGPADYRSRPRQVSSDPQDTPDDNPFLPGDEARGTFARPWWIWVIVAVAVIVIGGIIFILST